MPTRKNNGKVELAVMANDVRRIKTDVIEIKQRLDSKYVTKEEFDPVKKLVYGIVALILTAVVGALLGMVILK